MAGPAVAAVAVHLLQEEEADFSLLLPFEHNVINVHKSQPPEQHWNARENLARSVSFAFLLRAL